MKAGWTSSTLQEVANVEYGTRVVQKRDGGTIYPVYGGGGATFCVDRTNRSNCFIVSRFGMSPECVRYVSGDFFLNDSGLTVSTKSPRDLWQKFLDYQLLANQSAIYSLSRGTAQKNLDVDAFRMIQINIPDTLDEQRRIVAVLDKAFAGIATATANAQKNLTNARALFESVLDQIFEGDGSDWNAEPMNKVCIIGDGNHSSKYPKNSEMVPFGVPFLRSTNIQDGNISLNDVLYISPDKHRELKKGHLKTGDVLFTNRGEIGKVAIIGEDLDGANLNSQIAWLRCSDEIMPQYLFFYLQSGKMKKHYQQTQSGAALQQFTIKMLQNVKVRFPPRFKQVRLVEKLEKSRNEIGKLEASYNQKLATFTELKQSLLQKAFAGELT
ncbi:MAG: hypothetical protein B7Y89_11855 [Novosphingobium sp. 32-60-15]|uniref:restriction endonuclease subunit S n=1 Tax=unclassified Novosphingobium TaxID=2644732 RepID=UPI000BDCF68A|nr:MULTISPECIES: restriction endonuclease subunit S [unclassified Novosphingobium]OYX61841.1 MAG: hypothetical protein B7Y89_11855 [Novosphingobium sp. 32-60-15]